MRVLLLLVVVLFSCGTQEKKVEIEPFSANIFGEKVYFPTTVSKLLANNKAHYLPTGRYQIVTAEGRLDYFYDWHKYYTTIDSMGQYNIPEKTTFFGISITLSHKATAIDSVKKILEKEFRISMIPLTIKHLTQNEKGIYHIDSPVYMCSPQPGVHVSLRRSSCWRGDYPYRCGRIQYNDPPASDNPENSLRVSVSYGLRPDEEERFALGSGRIWKRTD